MSFPLDLHSGTTLGRQKQSNFNILGWHCSRSSSTSTSKSGMCAPQKAVLWKLAKSVGQSWFESIEIQKAITSNESKFSDKYFKYYICLTLSLLSKSVDVNIYSSTEWTGGRQDHFCAPHIPDPKASDPQTSFSGAPPRGVSLQHCWHWGAWRRHQLASYVGRQVGFIHNFTSICCVFIFVTFGFVMKHNK